MLGLGVAHREVLLLGIPPAGSVGFSSNTTGELIDATASLMCLMSDWATILRYCGSLEPIMASHWSNARLTWLIQLSIWLSWYPSVFGLILTVNDLFFSEWSFSWMSVAVIAAPLRQTTPLSVSEACDETGSLNGGKGESSGAVSESRHCFRPLEMVSGTIVCRSSRYHDRCAML